MERKVYEAEIKRFTGEGRGSAVLARLGVRDKDGDVLVPGLLGGTQQAPLLQSHQWQMPPSGRAVVREQDGELVADFALNLDSAGGKEWASVLKFDLERGPLQQWSWAFTVPPGGAESGMHEGQPVRFLKRIQLHEVSPVVVGASVGSRTVALKRDAPDQAALAAMHEQVRTMTLSPIMRQAPGGVGYKFLDVPRDDPKRGWAVKALGVAAEALGISSLKGIVSDVRFFEESPEWPDFRWERKLDGANFTGGLIGLRHDLAPAAMAETASHELLHVVRPKATEAECNRFGEQIAAKMLAVPRPGGHWTYDQMVAAATWMRHQGVRM